MEPDDPTPGSPGSPASPVPAAQNASDRTARTPATAASIPILSTARTPFVDRRSHDELAAGESARADRHDSVAEGTPYPARHERARDGVIVGSAGPPLSTNVDVVLTNEIPMDALTALVAERRDRYTTEAESFRLARTAARALRRARRAHRARTGTRVTVVGARPCA